MAEAVHIICINPGISYKKNNKWWIFKKKSVAWSILLVSDSRHLAVPGSPALLTLTPSNFQATRSISVGVSQMCDISGFDGLSNPSLVYI